MLSYEHDARANIALLSANCQGLIDILTEYFNAWLNLNVSKNVNSDNVMAELQKMCEIFTQVPSPPRHPPVAFNLVLLACSFRAAVTPNTPTHRHFLAQVLAMRRKNDNRGTEGKTGQRMVQKAIRESGRRLGPTTVSFQRPLKTFCARV
jgi:hypothetical protein